MYTDHNRVLSDGKGNSIVKKFFLLLLIMLIAGLLWGTGFPLPYFINNYRLNRFAEQFAKIPLPSQTKRITPIAREFGNLGTCSKHGDYYVEFKITTSLSYPQIRKFYDQFTIQVPDIDNMASTWFRGLGTHGPRTISIEEIEGVKNSYLIYVFDADYWPNDFRCW